MTDTETATELAMARDAVRERDRRQRLVDDAERVRRDAEARERAARTELRELAEDTDDLEGVSGARIWATLRGSRDEQLAELEARRVAAQAEVAAVAADVAAATEDVRRAFASLRGLGDAQARLDEAVRAREAWLLDSDTAEGREMGLVAARLDGARTARERADDLRGEARSASSLLGQAIGQLEEASDDARKDQWSENSWHDRRKYEHMEHADSLISSANASIARLRDGLEDAGLSGAAGIETGGSSRTMDTWFDNWWTDRRVRDEIDGTASQVHSTRRRVADLVDVLERRVDELDDEIRTLEARRTELLG